MSLVIDASVLVAATVRTDDEGRWAEEILSSGWLAAPELVLVESFNALRRLELAGRIEPFTAAKAFRHLCLMPIELFPTETVAERVWELRSNFTCYDALYVATAEALGVPLATLDRRLLRSTSPTCRILSPG